MKVTNNAITRFYTFVCVLVVFFGLSACGATGQPVRGTGDLERWIENDGAKYIIDQLQQDPRFAGASVQLVHLDGEYITPDVTAFGDEIRQQLFNAVLRVKSVDLAVRPSVQPWRAQRTLASVDCGLVRPVTHVIGLDLRESVSGDPRLSLRALDLRNNQWVSGFEKSWSGPMTQAQTQALRALATDLSLRGLRQLPFDGSQADLTASYLAQNLSCLLKQGAPSRLKLYIKPVVEGSPVYFNNVSTLIRRYMSQFREVDVVNDMSEANAVVNSDAVQLDSQLWQVWMGVAFTSNGQQVSGADTPAYVSLDQTSLFNQGKIILETRPELESAPERWRQSNASTTDLEAIQEPEIAVIAPSDSQSDQNTQAASQIQYFDNSSTIGRQVSIDSLDAVVPVDMARCRANDPWVLGERDITPGEKLDKADCFAVVAKFTATAVFLISETSEQQWFRLVSSECQKPAFANPSQVAMPGSLRFPDRAALGFTGKGDQETVYLIATADEKSTEVLAATLEKLPDACIADLGSSRSPLPGIKKLMQRSPDKFAMKLLTVLRSTT